VWTVLACILGIEALVGVEGLARFVGVAAGYDASVWLLAAVRGLVTALQGAAAWALAGRRPPAAVLTRVAVVASASLLTIEVGARLAPSSLPPGTQLPVVVTYWLYAAIVVLLLRGS
jgi:hypothetical protein